MLNEKKILLDIYCFYSVKCIFLVNDGINQTGNISENVFCVFFK